MTEKKTVKRVQTFIGGFFVAIRSTYCCSAKDNLLLTSMFDINGDGPRRECMTIMSGVSHIYRTNPKDLRNANFCVGCFELIISKNFATTSKMGKKYFIFAISFLQNPFLRKA